MAAIEELFQSVLDASPSERAGVLAEFAHGPPAIRAFIAMEWIDGLPVTRYAREHQLDIRARVALMASICDAVHAAHQQGVIHRDLKPANILVEAGGRSKVLDFGAGCLSEDMRAGAAIPELDVLTGTGPYLSPEHVHGDPRQIDTRSDVYALGVILFEVLAGRPPLDFAGMPVSEMVRQMRTERPPSLGAVAPVLKGDLSAVTDKALALEKDDRYQSVAELATDLRNYLECRPVVARHPSVGYSFRKLVARHPVLVSATMACALALLVATGSAVFWARSASRESDRKTAALAESAAAREEAEAAAEFLENMLTSASPEEIGRDVRVCDVLAHAVDGIADRFAKSPRAEARVREAIGRTYHALGEYALAKDQLVVAMAKDREVFGDKDPQTARCAIILGATLDTLEEHDAAFTMISDALEVYRADRGESSDQTIGAMVVLGRIEMQRQHFDAAITWYRQAMAAATARGGSPTRTELEGETSLAFALFRLGSYAEAEEISTRIVPQLLAMLGSNHPSTLDAELGAAAVARVLNHAEDAERMYRAVLRARQEVLGPDHPETLGATNDLAILLSTTGRYEEAREQLGRVLAGATVALGPNHRNTLKTRFNIAQTYVLEQRADEAEPLLVDLLPVQRSALGEHHVDVADTLQLLGAVRALQHRDAEAVDLYRESIEMFPELAPSSEGLIFSLRSERGESLRKLGRFDEAEHELRAAADGLVRLGSPHEDDARKALERLAQCCDATNPTAAAEARARLQEFLATQAPSASSGE